MTTPDLTSAVWRKSRKSQDNGGCVEVAFLEDGSVAVRDSKNIGQQPLVVAASEWTCFADAIANGDFAR